jgi:alkaline phosphatase D
MREVKSIRRGLLKRERPLNYVAQIKTPPLIQHSDVDRRSGFVQGIHCPSTGWARPARRWLATIRFSPDRHLSAFTRRDRLFTLTPSMRIAPLAVFTALLACFATCPLRAYDGAPEPGTLIRRIAFGACNSPLDTTPVWEAVINRFPDAWIWLGDTVYADSPRPIGPTAEARARVSLDRLPVHYARQNDLPGYRLLRQRARILGTWDDHDYGQNDAGADFVGRVESQRHFLDFYGVPADSPRRQRPGIYASHRLGPPGRVVQIVTLDTRYFRSPLLSIDSPGSGWIDGLPGTYLPSTDPAATVLGADQWRWLESVLRQPADLRVIVSSIQVLPDDHRFEKWGNFPAERRRLLSLIRSTGATGVVLLSGDRHTGELSRFDPAREADGAALDPGYPLYELTSSSLTKSAPSTFAAQLAATSPKAVTFKHEINRHRIGSTLAYNHFGLISVDWEATGGPALALALHLDHGEEVLRHVVPLSSLRPVR